MYINVIHVTYTYIMLRTIKPTYVMTVYCLRGAAPIGLLGTVQPACFHVSFMAIQSGAGGH
jgi:hypothetical protein